MSSKSAPLPPPVPISSWTEERVTIANHIKAMAQTDRPIQILEAGCGAGWGTNLDGLNYILSGIDCDEKALDVRTKQKKDMHEAILGDLRTAELEPGKYDVIFSSYVLEHIEGAEQVLQNFLKWLRPGGVILLIIPNRDSSWGFMTRITPFWFHVFYKKYVGRDKFAGTPGHAPYPTVYDRIVSRRGIHAYARAAGLEVEKEYSVGLGKRDTALAFYLLNSVLEQVISALSLFTLSARYSNMFFVLRKPAAAASR